MVTSIANFNVFVLPFITVFLIHIIKKQALKLDVSLLGEYAIFSALDMILTNAFIAFICFFFTELDVAVDSSYYTLIAFIVAIATAVLYSIVSKLVNINLIFENEKKTDEE